MLGCLRLSLGCHTAGLHQRPLPWAPGRDSDHRRTDRQRGASWSPRQQVRTSVEGVAVDPLCTWRPGGEGRPLSGALLHRVHRDVVVVAAHGQVRLQRRAGQVSGQEGGEGALRLPHPHSAMALSRGPTARHGDTGAPTAPCRDGLGPQCHVSGLRAPCCMGASGGAHRLVERP